MGSPNKDKDAPDNNEANKLPMIDRYMLNYGDWTKTMKDVEKADKKIKKGDKKEKIYWRGSTSGMNQTIFGADSNEVPCEKMAQVLLGEKPSNNSQSAWPRLKFILDSREKEGDIDAKFALWLPHFSKCWGPLFNKDYAKNTE
jgi:hypothetical protein